MIRAKRALKRLGKFVLSYNFKKCKAQFESDKVDHDEKKEEKILEKAEREERLRKLKPMKSRVLFFKNHSFRVDTLNRDVLWATEKRLPKNVIAMPQKTKNSHQKTTSLLPRLVSTDSARSGESND